MLNETQERVIKACFEDVMFVIKNYSEKFPDIASNITFSVSQNIMGLLYLRLMDIAGEKFAESILREVFEESMKRFVMQGRSILMGVKPAECEQVKVNMDRKGKFDA